MANISQSRSYANQLSLGDMLLIKYKVKIIVFAAMKTNHVDAAETCKLG
jgi:hypothetical protein